MRKALTILLLLTLVFTALPAAAETVTQDGVRATLTTDKEAYGDFDLVEATLTVENVSIQPVKNVTAYIVVPSGYVLEKGSQESAQAASLASGQTLTCKALLRRINLVPVTGDGSHIGLTVALMCASLGLVLAGILRGGEGKPQSASSACCLASAC